MPPGSLSTSAGIISFRLRMLDLRDSNWTLWGLSVAVCRFQTLISSGAATCTGIAFASTVLFIIFATWEELQAIPSSLDGAATSITAASRDNSFTDTYRCRPRPLPYDVNPRRLCLQCDGMIPRHEKGSSHVNEESEPLRSDTDVESDAMCTGHKLDYACEGLGNQLVKSSLKLYPAKDTTDVDHFYSTSKEEDVCPTCLEEYTTENPRIITKCSHHFHLGCIYEWMERSESCPVCGKEMVFDETT